MRITLIGGPTALVEINGLRLLTDPTFDAAGSEYARGQVVLRKTDGPVCGSKDLEPIDAVLLSNDQHADNLDDSGRAFLFRVRQVFTTEVGAQRLGGNAVGLAPWETEKFASADGIAALQITATSARHGPPGIEPGAGDVVGFAVAPAGRPGEAVYISGDTVW